jgi:hypothetical protein
MELNAIDNQIYNIWVNQFAAHIAELTSSLNWLIVREGTELRPWIYLEHLKTEYA